MNFPYADGLDRDLDPQREAIRASHRMPETEAVARVVEGATLDAEQAKAAHLLAWRLTDALRNSDHADGLGVLGGLVQGLMQEYALSSHEGVALMCLAEALLRIPDTATRDALIRDKIGQGDWSEHLGHSSSMFVNAASWGLLLTGRLAATHSEQGLGSALGRVIARSGEPVIRKGVDLAMRLLGEQFVTGETIEEALKKAKSHETEGFRYSFDMLGEAAMTAEDAERYRQSYERAIHAIGKQSTGKSCRDSHGISIKLSALHPRYFRAQHQRVMDELYPILLQLAKLAQQHDIGLNIDAEETERLDLSLDLLERLCLDPALEGFDGIGFVVQAYQRRCPDVIDWVIDLARRSQHRLMIRLVKGAYWDTEIKRAQIDGMSDYPVYTRKPHTDLCYLACARKLLNATDAVFPQFATHNAHSVAAIIQLAGTGFEAGDYEFQCLHGMGEPLYAALLNGSLGLKRPCRIYAPVGTHETLLAYLVRRLLENGANTSFVNRVADTSVDIAELIEDPYKTAKEMASKLDAPIGSPHPDIPLPLNIYEPARRNSLGIDLAADPVLLQLDKALGQSRQLKHRAHPLIHAEIPQDDSANQAVLNPADHSEQVGTVRETSAEELESALHSAQLAATRWAETPASERARCLDHAADSLQDALYEFTALMMREAGKSALNAVAEVREAIDFLRFYALQARTDLDNARDHALGPVVCISPWNFPLAIFTGQIAAALAAGNTVLAKPAEQTPLVATAMVSLLHAAGTPTDVLQLLPGRGEVVGAGLIADGRTRGVIFTGSTEVARLLQRSLATRLDDQNRPLPLIAETGGQNAMVVDSSALPEQVVADVLISAFDSAGQRCSALRVLCLQDEIHDSTLHMLKGAMDELYIGDPTRHRVDVGPLIDEDARRGIQSHIDAMRERGFKVTQSGRWLDDAEQAGSFLRPTLIEIDDISALEREVFGPVLHVLRYKRSSIEALIQKLNATGYGLTFGVHTRIDETVDQLCGGMHAGNQYVNRNIVGAVVGVQPFGGEGLSGTGPKAGGPLYLYRLLAEADGDVLQRAARFCKAELSDDGFATLARDAEADQALKALIAHLDDDTELADTLFSLQSLPLLFGVDLKGPTGERNHYALSAREAVLCLGDTPRDYLTQLGATLTVGARAVWPAEAAALRQSLPPQVREWIVLAENWRAMSVQVDAALCAEGDAERIRSTLKELASLDGPIISLHPCPVASARLPLAKLVNERSMSINTAAAGGNASLMTLD